MVDKNGKELLNQTLILGLNMHRLYSCMYTYIYIHYVILTYISELKESFSMFDKNGNGTILSKELGTVMRSLGLSPTEADIKELLTRDGRDGESKV